MATWAASCARERRDREPQGVIFFTPGFGVGLDGVGFAGVRLLLATFGSR